MHRQEQYPRIAVDPKFKVRLLGSWTTEIGELDQASIFYLIDLSSHLGI